MDDQRKKLRRPKIRARTLRDSDPQHVSSPNPGLTLPALVSERRISPSGGDPWRGLVPKPPSASKLSRKTKAAEEASKAGRGPRRAGVGSELDELKLAGPGRIVIGAWTVSCPPSQTGYRVLPPIKKAGLLPVTPAETTALLIHRLTPEGGSNAHSTLSPIKDVGEVFPGNTGLDSGAKEAVSLSSEVTGEAELVGSSVSVLEHLPTQQEEISSSSSPVPSSSAQAGWGAPTETLELKPCLDEDTEGDETRDETGSEAEATQQEDTLSVTSTAIMTGVCVDQDGEEEDNDGSDAGSDAAFQAIHAHVTVESVDDGDIDGDDVSVISERTLTPAEMPSIHPGESVIESFPRATVMHPHTLRTIIHGLMAQLKIMESPTALQDNNPAKLHMDLFNEIRHVLKHVQGIEVIFGQPESSQFSGDGAMAAIIAAAYHKLSLHSAANRAQLCAARNGSEAAITCMAESVAFVISNRGEGCLDDLEMTEEETAEEKAISRKTSSKCSVRSDNSTGLVKGSRHSLSSTSSKRSNRTWVYCSELEKTSRRSLSADSTKSNRTWVYCSELEKTSRRSLSADSTKSNKTWVYSSDLLSLSSYVSQPCGSDSWSTDVMMEECSTRPTEPSLSRLSQRSLSLTFSLEGECLDSHPKKAAEEEQKSEGKKKKKEGNRKNKKPRKKKVVPPGPDDTADTACSTKKPKQALLERISSALSSLLCFGCKKRTH